MALHSVSSISQLLRTNARSEPFPSILASGNAHLFVDYTGLCCKSKRAKRKLRAFRSPRGFQHCVTRSSSLVKAVLELDRFNKGLNDPAFPSDSKPQVANLVDIISERGACGVGFIANLDNKASHEIVKDALVALGCMEHRGGCGADNDSGDGSGLMTSIPWDLF